MKITLCLCLLSFMELLEIAIRDTCKDLKPINSGITETFVPLGHETNIQINGYILGASFGGALKKKKKKRGNVFW